MFKKTLAYPVQAPLTKSKRERTMPNGTSWCIQGFTEAENGARRDKTHLYTNGVV